MDVPAILAIIGGIALLVGLYGGGIKAKEVVIPPIPIWLRFISILAGTALIVVAIGLSLPRPVQFAIQQSPTSTPLPVPTSTPLPASTLTLTSPSTDIGISSVEGTWSGTMAAEQYTLGVTIVIRKPCEIGFICGQIAFPSFPCSSDYMLKSASEGRFVFTRKNTQGNCGGSGVDDVLQPLSDERILWMPIGGFTAATLTKR